MIRTILLLLTFLYMSPALARESYGVGKVVKASPEAKKALGFDYYLVVKKGNQVGAMPIDVGGTVVPTKISDLEGQFVIFRGEIGLELSPLAEDTVSVETIAFNKLKKISLADLRPEVDKFPKLEPASSFRLNPGASKWTFRLDNQFTQAALLTSAAFILNENTAYDSDGYSIGRDITRGVILSTGLLLMADRLNRAFSVEFGEWEMQEDRNE
jgi:hypothetical protein